MGLPRKWTGSKLDKLNRPLETRCQLKHLWHPHAIKLSKQYPATVPRGSYIRFLAWPPQPVFSPWVSEEIRQRLFSVWHAAPFSPTENSTAKRDRPSWSSTLELEIVQWHKKGETQPRLSGKTFAEPAQSPSSIRCSSTYIPAFSTLAAYLHTQSSPSA